MNPMVTISQKANNRYTKIRERNANITLKESHQTRGEESMRRKKKRA